jgi:hypothetical protein
MGEAKIVEVSSSAPNRELVAHVSVERYRFEAWWLVEVWVT